MKKISSSLFRPPISVLRVLRRPPSALRNPTFSLLFSALHLLFTTFSLGVISVSACIPANNG